MEQNYTIFHLHSDLSNGTTNIDSVTKYKQYIEKAKECGMTALGFSEHGNLFEWYHKKCDIEAAGMKYIHGEEFYITESLEEKIRDNYHCVLIAKNFDGFKEINRLSSQAFNRNDGHFYYVPRISIDELIHTSNNVIISSACLGSILHNGNDVIKQKFISFLADNNKRSFLEIQHHNDRNGEQLNYNRQLVSMGKKYNIPLIAGTDTHALNTEHLEGRSILQKSKNVYFVNEEDWDLSFKTYDELCKAYKLQGLDEDIYLKAIENTNRLVDMIEPFELDKNTKYPKLYGDSYETFKAQINTAYKKHPHVKERYSKQEILNRVNEELGVYEKTGCIDFMLLQTYLRSWEVENGIYCGPGRGSVSGSFIAYLLGVTKMDSIKFNLNFFRFLNPSRVTNADIDTDYSSIDREKVKQFILKEHMKLDNIQSSEIITFNTIALKGSIRDVCRALYLTDDKGKQSKEYLNIANYICDNIETNEDRVRSEYPDVFRYVDIVNGVIVSIGSHPSGVLITDKDINEMIGTCSLSTSPYPVSMLNMKELDALMYVKLDILGLDNVGVINDTCKLAGIPLLTPDNIDLEDEKVWESIREDSTMIFQWESASAQAYLKRFMSDKTINIVKNKVKNFKYLKWFSFGNGLLRPACASYRNSVANGEFYDNGFKELDEFLAPTMGHVTMQEDIMQFLVKFCGYSQAESDTVRRGIAKKYGTEALLPEIEQRFIEYSSLTFNITKEECKEIIKPFLQVLLDASSYGFSWNHSDAYSCIGYICGYLRYYYPYEFLTAALNIFESKEEKTQAIIKYAQKNDIKIEGIKFRYSTPEYAFDKETKAIYKGMSSIKYLNKRISQELFALREETFDTFIDLLERLEQTTIDSRQLEILIKLNFFSEFGEIKALLLQSELYAQLGHTKILKPETLKAMSIDTEWLIQNFGGYATEKQIKNVDIKGLLKYLVSNTKYPGTTVIDKINYETEYLGYISIKMPDISEQYAYVLDVNKKYANKVIKIYRLKTGEVEALKVKAKKYDLNPIEPQMIIKTIEAGEEKKWYKDEEGRWQQKDETEMILYKWSKIKC